jgi:expansin (peptidoglycan-binding protein)
MEDLVATKKQEEAGLIVFFCIVAAVVLILACAIGKPTTASCVKVINAKTGRSVDVEINDRGPAKRLVRQGREIDLSRAAFARIADLRQGVVPVKISLLSK